jgi:asparagine synthase (glutamine-hydrolysing)
MSGICGLFHRNGRPSDPTVLGHMSEAMSRRGPHGSGSWVQGSVALGHRRLQVDTGLSSESQPCRDEEGQLCITMDGRVDNPEELRSSLLAKGVKLRTRSDLELVMRAYEVWGEDSPRHILGDFAYAIWDGRRRRLFCARDPVGVKPFVYHVDVDSFSFASEAHVLLKTNQVHARPNEGMISEVLIDDFRSREETLVEGILRLPPAFSLTITDDRVDKRRYWDIDPELTLQYRDNEEYSDHFRQVFKEAVDCRLRGCKSPGVLLSGGLDSTSIFATALGGLSRTGEIPAVGYSLVFPGNPCDESPLIMALLERYGASGFRIEPQMPDLDHFVSQIRFYRDVPDYPNQAAWDSLMRLVVGQGTSVLLTGLGGDQWFDGRVGRFVGLLVGMSVPAAAIRAIVRLKRKVQHRTIDPSRALTAAFIRRANLSDRLRSSPDTLKGRSFVFGHHYRFLTSGWEPHALEMVDRSSAGFGVEDRHPFFDRRLIELSFAVPLQQRFSNGYTKFILREAMRGYLPESIRLRKEKADFSHLFPEAIQLQGGPELFSGMEIAKAGWVSEEIVVSMYKRMVHLYNSRDEGFTRDIWQLAMIAGLELWFRTLFSGR